MLRPFQQILKSEVYNAWDCGHTPLVVSPTGSGKTVTFSDILREFTGPSCAIAHRQELVTQMSIALNVEKVKHKIIGPENVIKQCINAHITSNNHSYYDPGAQCAIAGVDTLTRRVDKLKSWSDSVGLWVQDEAHHIQPDNKWGKSLKMFPNAKGVGFTATAYRTDGNGFKNIFDQLIIGPTTRELIDLGYLTNYRIFAPPNDLDREHIPVGNDGEYTRQGVTDAVGESRVVGDVVKHYLKIAPGKLGVTFADSVATCHKIAKRFNDAGVPAAVISAKTPVNERVKILNDFKLRKILQIVNVDILGEGFDCPAIEVVSFARPTNSRGLYIQQFGRALRLLVGKLWAIIIDHVGNVENHGLPDSPQPHSLTSRAKNPRTVNDDIPTTTCLNDDCYAVFPRVLKICPYCGLKRVVINTRSVEHVDGDLIELSPETLAEMRGEVGIMDMTPNEYKVYLIDKWVPKIGHNQAIKRHINNQNSQKSLRELLAVWGGYRRYEGQEDSEIYKRFYWKFGVDMISACALKSKDAESLLNNIIEDIMRCND